MNLFNNPSSLFQWTFMFLFIGLGLSACSQTGTPEEPESLKEAYSDLFFMGTAMNGGHISGSDSASVELILREFNQITPENILKPGPVNPQPGQYNFGPGDDFVAFGEANDMFIVGHTLVWHSQTPGWFFTDEEGNPKTRDAQIEQMRSHIEAVAGRYAGRIDGWDVLNEALNDDGTLRQSAWLNNIGEDYISMAFQFADEHAPDAELYYNDYSLWNPDKRDGVMRLVRNLQDQGIRIDGVGMQGHWGLDYPELQQIEASIDSFASLGVKVMITELDIDVLPRQGGPTADISATQAMGDDAMNPWTDGLPDDMQQQLADRYADIFQIFYARRDVISRVTFWGVHDGQSWKNGFPIRGRTNYPLLFGRDHQPKPAYDAVMAVPAQ